MSLEQAHQRSLQERPHHPDEPQPVKWTGRRAARWSIDYLVLDDMYANDPENIGNGRRRNA